MIFLKQNSSIPWFGAGIPSHWGYIFWASVFYALGGMLYTRTIYLLDISVFTPLFSFRTVMAVIIGALFLGEVLTLHQYVLIGIISIFGMLVSVDERWSVKSFFNWKILLALLDMFCLALMALFIKKAVAETGFWDTALWVALIGQVWFLCTIPLFKKDFAKTKLKQYGNIAIVAVFGIVSTFTVNAAYAKNISIVSAIVSLPISMVIAFAFSRLAPELLEKHTLKVYAVRFAAAAIMIIAALNL